MASTAPADEEEQLSGPRFLSTPGTRGRQRHQMPIAAALDLDAVPTLPEWSYGRWWQVLQYPDVGDRAHRVTLERGQRRDEVLGHPAVVALVEWAGQRRRRDPLAAAAGALAALASIQSCPVEQRPDAESAARLLAEAVDRARPLHMVSRRHDAVLVDPGRVADVPADAPPAENPRLAAVVGGLLRLATTDPFGPLAGRVVDAVVQAADWWATHALALPTSIDGPRLPGIVPAQDLPVAERLSHALRDVDLRGLVAGPYPGRGRPCQVAWRRGLTYWTAVRLADVAEDPPPAATLRWWRTQLTALDARRTESATPALLRNQIRAVS